MRGVYTERRLDAILGAVVRTAFGTTNHTVHTIISGKSS